MAHTDFGGPQILQRHIRELSHKAKTKTAGKGPLAKRERQVLGNQKVREQIGALPRAGPNKHIEEIYQRCQQGSFHPTPGSRMTCRHMSQAATCP